MLSDSDIKNALDDRMISVEPYDETLLQPSSLDLRLDRYFTETAARISGYTFPAIIDPSEDQAEYCTTREISNDGCYDLMPNRVLLATTYEYVKLSQYVAAKVEGKSSLGRIGLLIHSTAGFIDPGFEGQVTLELANLNDRPIRLYAGMKIAQVCFFYLHSCPRDVYGSEVYGSHYQHQRGPQPSTAHQRFRKGLPARE